MDKNNLGLFSGARKKLVFLSGFFAGIAFTSFIGFLFVVLVSLSIKSGLISLDGNIPKQVAGETDEEFEIVLEPVDVNKDHILGNPEAKISLVEFSDLECPFCKKFHAITKEVLAEYGDEVNIVFRHFPLDSLHTKARKEAEATECAAEQGKFWEYLDKIFEITPSNDGLPDSALGEIASELGLDGNQFDSCLAEGKYKDKVESHVKQAAGAGGRGTPYSVLVDQDGNTSPVNGALPLATFRPQIDELLN